MRQHREIRGAKPLQLTSQVTSENSPARRRGSLAINEDFIRDNIAVASAALVDRRTTRVPGFFIGRSRGINWRELIKRHKLDAAR